MRKRQKRLQKEFMPEDTNAGIIQEFLDDYDDDYVCTRILFDEALHRTGEMKQWEGKEIANIMNNAIVGWNHMVHIGWKGIWNTAVMETDRRLCEER